MTFKRFMSIQWGLFIGIPLIGALLYPFSYGWDIYNFIQAFFNYVAGISVFFLRMRDTINLDSFEPYRTNEVSLSFLFCIFSFQCGVFYPFYKWLFLKLHNPYPILCLQAILSIVSVILVLISVYGIGSIPSTYELYQKSSTW